MNTATIFGNLGKDPEIKTTASGLKICMFSVADTYSFKKGDEWQKKTSWWTVKMFGKKAEWAAEQLKKGQTVALMGRFEIEEWQAADGSKKSATVFMAEEFVGGAGR